MIDTCQANTMYGAFYTPNIISTGSSALDQSSYSHHADQDVGVAVIDRWTYYNLEFLETHLTSTSSNVTLGDLFDSYDPAKVHSDAGIRYDLFAGGEGEARKRRIVDFFGNVQGVEVNAEKDQDESLVDWKSDLEALRKMLDRQREALAAAGESEDSMTVQPGSHHAQPPLKRRKVLKVESAGPKPVDATSTETKQAVGTAVLLLVVGAFGLINWFDK